MGLDNPLHIAFLVVILLLVFGARRLPEIGRSLGSGMREFKESVTGDSKPATTLNAGQQPAQPQQVAQPAQAQPAQPAQPQQPVQAPPPAAAPIPPVAPPPAEPASVAGSDRSAPPETQTPGSA